MSKSEHDYQIVGLNGTLHNPAAATDLLRKQTEEGWDVQQIFTGQVSGESDQTFALLKRKNK